MKKRKRMIDEFFSQKENSSINNKQNAKNTGEEKKKVTRKSPKKKDKEDKNSILNYFQSKNGKVKVDKKEEMEKIVIEIESSNDSISDSNEPKQNKKNKTLKKKSDSLTKQVEEKKDVPIHPFFLISKPTKEAGNNDKNQIKIKKELECPLFPSVSHINAPEIEDYQITNDYKENQIFKQSTTSSQIEPYCYAQIRHGENQILDEEEKTLKYSENFVDKKKTEQFLEEILQDFKEIAKKQQHPNNNFKNKESLAQLIENLSQKKKNSLHISNLFESEDEDFSFFVNAGNMWCTNYKPDSIEEVMNLHPGSKSAFLEIEEWLKKWKEKKFIKKKSPRKKKKSKNSSEDDDYSELDFDNVLLIVGPNGCGKNSLVKKSKKKKIQS